jgi:transposase
MRMDVYVERIAGIDIGKATLSVTIRVAQQGSNRRRQVTRTYATMTGALLTMVDWLTAEGITRVVMEATCDYWKPVYYLLEAAERFEVWLVNAYHVKGVPGRRKSDNIDSAWLAQVGECELVRPSFVPPQPIRELRDLTRYRTSLVRDRTRIAQRLEKMLEDAGIKLTVVASEILGASSRAIIGALVEGERDPIVLAELAKARLRNKRPALVEALTGRFTDHHGFLCRQMLEHIAALDDQVTVMDTEIDRVTEPYRQRITQLVTVPGISTITADRLIAEIGVDMSVFPTPEHLTAWAGMAPRPRSSAGKTKHGSTGKGNRHLAGVLGEIVATIARGNTFLGVRHRRLAARRGKRRAIVATSRHLLIIVWHLLNDPTATTTFHDLGPDYHLTRLDPAKRTRNLIHQLEQLGHKVTLEPAA